MTQTTILLRETVRAVMTELAGGCSYESTVLRAIRKAGAAGNIRRAACADSSVPDADIMIDGHVHPIEVKANSHAQMGGGSVRYSTADRRFTCANECSDISAVVVDVLSSAPDAEALKTALDTLIAFVAAKTRGREILGFPMSGFKPRTWELAAARGLLQPINRYIEADVAVIERHYAAKGTSYIQIGGAGLFRLGKADPAGFRVPRLTGAVKLELRAAKAGDAGRSSSKAGLRVQARLATVGSSPFTLDDPESVKALVARAQRVQSSARMTTAA